MHGFHLNATHKTRLVYHPVKPYHLILFNLCWHHDFLGHVQLQTYISHLCHGFPNFFSQAPLPALENTPPGPRLGNPALMYTIIDMTRGILMMHYPTTQPTTHTSHSLGTTGLCKGDSIDKCSNSGRLVWVVWVWLESYHFFSIGRQYVYL